MKIFKNAITQDYWWLIFIFNVILTWITLFSTSAYFIPYWIDAILGLGLLISFVYMLIVSFYAINTASSKLRNLVALLLFWGVAIFNTLLCAYFSMYASVDKTLAIGYII